MTARRNGPWAGKGSTRIGSVLFVSTTIPLGDQFIGTIWDPWGLAEYKATGGANIFLDQIERVANVDTHLLKCFIGKPPRPGTLG
ncbi:hypothetical protein BBI09_05745 [Stutzerimonas xanthomarina]|nr:hypothetical protein BBI09_05745 [Stutzerimonas xanthomarina]